MSQDPESARLEEARTAKTPWRKWGPYLSERKWGTVREDYSQDGNAWDYFTHDQARSRAYHWLVIRSKCRGRRHTKDG
jgi:hypothetical protein